MKGFCFKVLILLEVTFTSFVKTSDGRNRQPATRSLEIKKAAFLAASFITNYLNDDQLV
jgi:hypothetical protein